MAKALETRALETTFSSGKPNFDNLPDEIIESILVNCDPNTFASLVLLNSTWHRVSQQAHLYALQLSRCRPHGPFVDENPIPLTEESLAKLRRLFAEEIQRRLFEAYCRPTVTEIKLVSNSISSSAAFPGGEAFHFAFSPTGQCALAYSTSRIHILRLAGPEVSVVRELKILRRPASVSIVDDATVLAVLSTDHQIDVYDVKSDKPRHMRAIQLDHAPRTIALDPTGKVVAAAYDGGIEVYSIVTTLSSIEKRAVKTDAVDCLEFSLDGTQLLGTTLHSKTPSTVILTAPYFNSAEHSPEETITQLWTSSILFPSSTRDCSHATLLPIAYEFDVSWTFAYDQVYETFRAVRTDDLRNGTTYFTGPIPDASTKLFPSTVPAAHRTGKFVAAGFGNEEIWMYGVPESLDMPTTAKENFDIASLESAADAHDRSSSSGAGQPRVAPWQEISDKNRNTFIKGRHIGTLSGLTGFKWVRCTERSLDERLVAAAPGGLFRTARSAEDFEDEDMCPVDGGRLLIMDFGYTPQEGQRRVVTIEVGDKEPEILEEEHRDIETEVAIVRRRTVAQNAQAPGRTHDRRQGGQGVPPVPSLVRRGSTDKSRLPVMEEDAESESLVTLTEQEAFDTPYVAGAPRSQSTLRRAATAAAFNRVLHPPRLAQQLLVPIPMRRADGFGELPHESDADNWVPPPPPYSREPPPSLPEHLRNAIDAGAIALPSPGHLRRSSTVRSTSSTGSSTRLGLQRSRSIHAMRMSPILPTLNSPHWPSVDISSDTAADHAPSGAGRSQDDPSGDDFDDMYDVSRHGTPQPAEPSSDEDVEEGGEGPEPLTVTATETLAEPLSPRPRHAVPLLELPGASRCGEQLEPVIATSPYAPIPPAAPSLVPLRSRTISGGPPTLANLNAALPPRPNHDHHVTELPLNSPISPLNLYRQADINDVVAAESARAAQINAQPPLAPATHVDAVQDSIAPPSAEQMARLNSRQSRPNSRLFDQNRGTHAMPRVTPVIQLPQLNRSLPSLVTRSHQSYDFGPPQAARGAVGSPMTASPSSPLDWAPTHRTNTFPRDTFRPQISRLETIHSMSSNGGEAPIMQVISGNRPIPVGVSRHPSRAEKSAVINMQKAKRKGWGGSAKRKKTGKKAGAERQMSDAEWTNLGSSRESTGLSERERKGKKEKSKCKVM